MEKKNKNNKKIFGLFNIIDILIVVFVLIALIIGVKLIKANSNELNVSKAEVKEIKYVVNCQNQQLDALGHLKTGDKVYNSNTSEYLGIVSDVKYEEQVNTMFNAYKGQYEKYKYPGKYVLNITIKGNGAETDKDVIVESNNIKIGKQINVKGKGYVFTGFIVDIILE